MSLTKFVFWLLAPFGLFLIAGGFAFQQFQVWAVTQPASPLNIIATLELSAKNQDANSAKSNKSSVEQFASKYQEFKQNIKPSSAIIENPVSRAANNLPAQETSVAAKPSKLDADSETLKKPSPKPSQNQVVATSQPVAQKPKAKLTGKLDKPQDVVANSAPQQAAKQTQKQTQAQRAEVRAEPKPQQLKTQQPKPQQPKPVENIAELDSANSTFAVEPVLSEFPDHLLLNFEKSIVSEQNLIRAIARVLLSPEPYAEQSLISRAAFNYQERPAFYRQIISHKDKPIRYPAEALEYAKFLIEPYGFAIKNQKSLAIKIPLRESNLAYPARRYESLALQFAQDFRISPALVLAIMETESNFNPKAVSRSQAKGLMQIKPNSAGRDVYKYIDLKFGAPSDAELFDEASNIRMGTAYLSLLKYEYFADIKNSETKEMIAISSYNGGLSTVWKIFGKSPEEAIVKINQLHPRQVYRKLRYDHASDETRQYIDKVLQAKARYQALLGEDARVLAFR